MTDPFSQAADALFASPLARDGFFRPAEGKGNAVRVILPKPETEADLGVGGLRAPLRIAEVRVSEIADPRKGDRLEVDGAVHVIRRAPKDRAGLIWLLDLDE